MIRRDAKLLTVQPPLKGIIKNTGFQTQPPYSAYELLNMWPFDPFTGRYILASRAPFNVLTSPSGFCNMIQSVNAVVMGKPEQSFATAFGSDIYWWNGTGFTAATGAQASAVDENRAIYPSTFLDEVFIPTASAKPIVFDYSTGAAATLVETAGTAPSNTRFSVVWQGAVWLFGAPDNPHIIYASRIGDGHDYDFTVSSDDLGRAFQSTSSDTFGRLNGPVTAAMPHTTDSMVLSTLGNGLSMAYRHPNQGGQLVPFGGNLFALGQGAWCKDASDTLYILTQQGIVVLDSSPNAVPVPLSKQIMPEELIGLDYNYENPVVSMAYCSRWNCIFICVRGPQEQAWMYNINTGGFFRMEFTGYPYVMHEFAPFVTDQTCGVLFGGVNVKNFDKFGDETFESSGLIGPIRTSDSILTKSKIQRLRVVFGGDTPTGDGTFAIAMGADGEDAITRAIQGGYQYSVGMAELSASDGVCLPHVAGGAAVFAFSQDSGRVSFEPMEAVTIPTGLNRLVRTTPIAQEGEAIDFTEPSNEFDDDAWVGYSEATPATPNCTLPDFTHWVDLSRLPAGWWNTVNSDGSDIRATNNDNIEIPTDLIYWDYDNEEGFLALKLTQQNPPTPVRLWVGNVLAGQYAPTDTNGQYNSYDSNWKAFWPFGGARDDGELDRTVNANDLTLVNQVDAANNLVAGPIGVQATDYTLQDATNNYGRATAAVVTGVPATLVIVASDPDTTSLAALGLRVAAGNGNLELTTQRGASTQSAQATSTNSSGTGVTAQSGTLANSTNWRHYAGVFASTTSRSAYLNGGNAGTSTTSNTPPTLDEIIIGKGSRSGLSSNSTTAALTLAQVHNVARSECWVNYQFQMLDQDAFWGNWGDFQEINDPDDLVPLPNPEPPPTAQCPSGVVIPTETGSWSGYAEATPQSTPTITLLHWVNWIDLSEMPASWWSAVASDGSDIRATDRDNQFIALDLIEFDYAGQTGFVAVRLTQREGTADPIRLWVGNGSASAIPDCAEYGRYNVYDKNWLGFWPSGGGEDRTQYRNDLTETETITVGGVTGPIGNFATNYDGIGYSTALISPALPSFPATLAAVTRVSAFTQTGAVVSATRTQFLSHDTVVHTPYTTPTRFRSRANEQTYDAASETTESAATWTHKVGFAANNIVRGVVVAGGTLYDAAKRSLPRRSFARISIGARITASGAVYWPFTGDIALVSAHNTTRALDNSWAAYQAAMLDQSTFWGTWDWTADVNSLPQS